MAAAAEQGRAATGAGGARPGQAKGPVGLSRLGGRVVSRPRRCHGVRWAS